MIFVALSNATYRVSLRSKGSELDGDVKVQTPLARRVWRRAPARRGLVQLRALKVLIVLLTGRRASSHPLA